MSFNVLSAFQAGIVSNQGNFDHFNIILCHSVGHFQTNRGQKSIKKSNLSGFVQLRVDFDHFGVKVENNYIIEVEFLFRVDKS